MLKKIFSRSTTKKNDANALPNLPNVICIGTQKAGTTWLYEMFKQHPDVEFAITNKNKVRKEVHFWDLFYEKGLDWYKSLFTQGRPIRCDITPAYCILGGKKLKHFYQVLPQAKLLMIVRNPIDRAWSLALMNLKHQGLSLNDVDNQWFIDQFNDQGSFLRGDYPSIIKKWQSFYSSDQLLILNYDDLMLKPKDFLLKVCNHFGIDKTPYIPKKDVFFKQRVFESKALRISKEQHAYLLEKYSSIIDQTGNLLGWDVEHWKHLDDTSQDQVVDVPIVEEASSLKNTGIAVLGDRDCIQNDKKTIIVVGVARGGTSMIAGSLHHLGLFGGERSGPPVYEDVALAEAFENKDVKKIDELISRYNQNHDTWFFKRPSVIDYLDEVSEKLRNPIFIFIFKDIFTVSNRNKISMQQDVLQGLFKAHDDYSKILNFLQRNSSINGLLVSYEKALLHTADFIDGLTSTLFKSSITPVQKQKLLSFIEPAPEHYLDVSRKTKVVGSLDVVTPVWLAGWAKSTYNSKKVILNILVNGHLVAKSQANKELNFLTEENMGCGFGIELNTKLQKGDTVVIRAEGEVNDLKGTPFVFQDNSPAKELRAARNDDSSLVKPNTTWLVSDTTQVVFDYIGLWLGEQTPDNSVVYDDGINSTQTSNIVVRSYQSGDMFEFWREFKERVNAGFILARANPQKYFGLVKCTRVACFVCNPVDLVLRSYEFNKRFKGFEGSLTEFVQIPRFRNMQHRQLNSTPVNFLGVIGIIDELEKSIQLMANSLELSDESFNLKELVADISEKKTKDISEETIDLIEKYNQQDVEMHKAAAVEFEKRFVAFSGKKQYAHGFVQSQTPQRVVGCAFYAESSEPVSIEVHVNDTLVKTMKATERRPGLSGFNLPRMGYVGFSYQFPKPLSEGDICVCKVAATGQII